MSASPVEASAARSTAAVQSLDFADRWLRDGLHAVRPPLSLYQVTVDMTRVLAQLDELRKAGVAASSTHFVIKAAAMTLVANPALHHLVAGQRRHRLDTVQIALSTSGDAFVNPIVVIDHADRLTVTEIAAETARLVPIAREADRQLLAALNRWGWVLPFGFVRRAFFRVMHRSVDFRRKAAGTFQVTTTPLDWACSAVFSSIGVLVAGQIAQGVVAVDGQPVVRPLMKLTLSSDHSLWDGRGAARFMAGVKSVLERADA